MQLDFLIAGFARSGTHSVRGGTKSSQGHFINILETCSATFLVLAVDIIIYNTLCNIVYLIHTHIYIYILCVNDNNKK